MQYRTDHGPPPAELTDCVFIIAFHDSEGWRFEGAVVDLAGGTIADAIKTAVQADPGLATRVPLVAKRVQATDLKSTRRTQAAPPPPPPAEVTIEDYVAPAPAPAP